MRISKTAQALAVVSSSKIGVLGLGAAMLGQSNPCLTLLHFASFSLTLNITSRLDFVGICTKELRLPTSTHFELWLEMCVESSFLFSIFSLLYSISLNYNIPMSVCDFQR